MTASPTPAVEVVGLRKAYGALQAVDGVDLHVAPGETFGFLGPNGAGKSTTIKILCTLVAPTGGTARVAGYDVVAERAEVRRHIGLVFQDTTLDAYLSAELNLRFHAELYGIPKAALEPRLRQVLEMVGLWERREDKVQNFSGGMKRRLEIARGLMHSPRVLFLDEPTVGLDPQTRSSIWGYINELRERENITIFLTTHYMDEAENCDRIAIMDAGRIVALDTPEALKASVGEDRVRISTVDDDAAVAALGQEFGIEAVVRDGLVTFGVSDGERFVPRLFDELGVTIRSVETTRPSLDDVFLTYTGRTIRDAEVTAGDVNRAIHSCRGGGDRVTAEHRTAAGGAQAEPATADHQVVPVSVAEPGLAQDYRAVKVVLKRELIRFGQDRTRIISAMVQPVLFLFVLGTGLSSLTEGSTGGVDLRTFMFPGILATSTLFTAMFSAVSIVWDREFGFLREMLVAPVRRSSIMIGKTLGGAAVATLQACLVLALAPLVDVSLSVGLVIVLILLVFLLAFTLTSFGLVIAARIQQMQTVMSIMQMLLLPLSFLSGALYPISNLPEWLNFLVRLNPITYAVNAVRTVVFDELDASPEAMAVLNPPITWWGWPVPLWLEVVIVGVLGVVFLGVAVKQFEKAE